VNISLLPEAFAKLENLHGGGKRLLINLKVRMPRDSLLFLITHI
jgi:hypothetical protein